MFTLNCKGRLLKTDEPLVMGIINATPDSFYEGSRFTGVDSILEQARKMIGEGAVILDIGGQSTRPGAERLGIAEECERVLPAIAAVSRHFPDAIISIDTYFSQVAEEAVAAGASIVNDISGGRADKEMLPVVGKLRVPYVCMHSKGDISTMHQHFVYDDLCKEVLDYFIERKQACIQSGIHDFIIDPGFGFSKNAAQNFGLLRNLEVFDMLESPLLAGLSRKSTIYKTLGSTAEQALNGTTVLNTIALMKGACILRVHDVKEAREAVKLVMAMKNAGAQGT